MTINKCEYVFKKVPPESGWGYMIAIGMALPFICALSSMPSFGLMFGDFLNSLGEKTSAIALITSSFFSAFSFAGLFTNILFRKFAIRSVGVAGAILYFIGSLMTIFVTSVEQLLFAFSVLQGAGFGIIIPVAYTTFNAYFVNRRVIMMSIAQSLIGLGTMIYPIIVQYLMELYGFRGCMAILAAINGHAILGMLTMHPVEWHMKKVQIPIEVNHHQTELLIYRKSSMISTDVKIIVQSTDDNESHPFDDNIKNNKNHNLHVPRRNSFAVDLLKNNDTMERKASLDPSQFDENFPSSRRASSISSIGNWTGAVIVSNATDTMSPNGKWKAVVDFLDLTLLNDPIYVNIVLGISFALYSDMAFFTLQPLYLFELGYTKSDTAFIISAGAGADLLSRIFLAISSLCIQTKARHIYLAGAIFTIIIRFIFINLYDFNSILAITCIMGFLRTWLHVPLPLVFAEYLPSERFPSGYGLFMFLQGNITFAIGPFIGWIRDVTQSYELSFHGLSFVMSLCAIPWLIELLMNKKKYQNNQTNG